nr:M6 family metalloprotease domain-containing protein [Candidatus Sigynarchaeota archaeon]
MKKVTPLLAIAACSFLVGILAMPMVIPEMQTYIKQIKPASITPKQTDDKGIKPGGISLQGATGNKKILVILLEFQDVTHGSSKTQAYYQSLLFDRSNSHSMASYYWECSYGRLNLTGTVTQWVKSSHDMAYYGADSGPFPNIDDANGNIFEVAREAVQLADPYVNYATFDADSDGYVDNLIVVHAGEGQESSSVADDIWSHRWTIQPAETTGDSGKKASDYALLAESSPVGVFAHEYGHVLGLPDMYDYTYSGQVFVGHWALMDSGSWNGYPEGDEPSHLIGWSKMQLGFITPGERTDVHVNEVKTVNIVPSSR